MSLVDFHRVDVTCDAPGCLAFRQGHEQSYSVSDEQARRDAAESGWVCREGRDLCPEHGDELEGED